MGRAPEVRPPPGPAKRKCWGPGERGLVATVVAMATEPEAAEPAVPSLVDRYFTRWYKAGKRGMVSVCVRPHWPEAVGTVVTDDKPRAITPALPPHVWRNWISLFPSRRKEWQLQTRSPEIQPDALWGWRCSASSRVGRLREDSSSLR